MYDRPVCATTTRLTGIPQNEKDTVGINRPRRPHLYEFHSGDSRATWPIHLFL